MHGSAPAGSGGAAPCEGAFLPGRCLVPVQLLASLHPGGVRECWEPVALATAGSSRSGEEPAGLFSYTNSFKVIPDIYYTFAWASNFWGFGNLKKSDLILRSVRNGNPKGLALSLAAHCNVWWKNKGSTNSFQNPALVLW